MQLYVLGACCRAVRMHGWSPCVAPVVVAYPAHPCLPLLSRSVVHLSQITYLAGLRSWRMDLLVEMLLLRWACSLLLLTSGLDGMLSYHSVMRSYGSGTFLVSYRIVSYMVIFRPCIVFCSTLGIVSNLSAVKIAMTWCLLSTYHTVVCIVCKQSVHQQSYGHRCHADIESPVLPTDAPQV